MTPKPPEGFETWLPWIEWILSLDPKCEVFAREPVEFLIAELAALRARVDEVFAKLAAKSSSALRTTKAAADAITMAAFEPALAHELAGQTRLLQSVEFQQTMAAFAKHQA